MTDWVKKMKPKYCFCLMLWIDAVSPLTDDDDDKFTR